MPSSLTPRNSPKQAGFTLIEVMVAFVIVALSLGALTQGALGGLRSSRISGHYQEAVSRARSRLATLGHGVALRPGEQEGDDGGGFRWRTRVTQFAVTAAPQADGVQTPRVALYDVSVGVSWRMDGGTREVVLESRRLALARSAAP